MHIITNIFPTIIQKKRDTYYIRDEEQKQWDCPERNGKNKLSRFCCVMFDKSLFKKIFVGVIVSILLVLFQ